MRKQRLKPNVTPEGRQIAKVLNSYLQQAGKTQLVIAASLRVSGATVSRWCAGEPPGRDNLLKLSEVTGVPLSEFVGRDQTIVAESALTFGAVGVSAQAIVKRRRRIPIVGTVCAGAGDEDGDLVVWEDWVFNPEWSDLDQGEPVEQYDYCDIGPHMYEMALHAPNNRVLAARVTGDSMQPYYQEDDLVLVERTKDTDLLKDRDHVVVDLNSRGRFVLRMWRAGDPPFLQPFNPSHKPIIPTPEAELFGIVVLMQRVHLPPEMRRKKGKRKGSTGVPPVK